MDPLALNDKPFLADLEDRGLLKQKTAEVTEPDFGSRPALYVGFDPSAGSLHAGSLLPLLTMDRFRRRGGQVIVLLGGATGLIGDPSGKDQERNLESHDVVQRRIGQLHAQVSGFFARTEGPPPIFVNNADWYRGMDVLSFLRDVGKHFSVNQMLTRDSVRARIENREQGISYTEFSYQLLQSYDFLHLSREHRCTLQMGASDQWGNIVSGVDLVRRCTGQTVGGITLPLLTNSQGKKYGKSEKGAVWLDPALTSAYAFYQFWLNTADEDAPRFLLWLTDHDAQAIEALRAQPAFERAPQKALAFALTQRVHGAIDARHAQQASEVVFSGRFELLNPGVVRMLSDTVATWQVVDAPSARVGAALVGLGAAKSKTEARRLVEQRSVHANGVLVTSMEEGLRQFAQGLPAVVLAVGKNRRFLVLLEGEDPPLAGGPAA